MLKRSSDYTGPFSACDRIIAAAVIISWSAASPEAAAQDIFMDDTVTIAAVTVTAGVSGRHAPFSAVKIDSSMMARHEGRDLAVMLQSSSLWSVRRYGNHGLASVSIRGMSGSHTAVTWNGLPVNPTGSGMADFAIIPLSVATSVRIAPGGSDLESITGSVGGRVELSTASYFNGLQAVSLSSGAGSYGDFSSSAVLRTGTDNTSLRLSAWGFTSRNDFRFTNMNSPGGSTEERRTNASVEGAGVTTDFFMRLKRSVLSAHLWYNDADRELPGPVTTVQQDFGEKQRDKAVRGILRFSSKPGRLSAEVFGGGSHDVNLYFHDNPAFNGDNRSELWLAGARLSFRLNQKTELILNTGDEYRKASSLSFEGSAVQNIFSASMAVKYNPVQRLRLLLQARQMAVTGTSTGPELTAAASWLLSPNGEHVIKAGLSRNMKLPCLNDLYWMPGGNPDLSPETSEGGELSWSFAGTSGSGVRNTVDITFHASVVDNLIQWLPNITGIWAAENVRSVVVSGVEARAGKEVTLGAWEIKSHLNYALTRSVIAGSEIANDRSVGSQLIYMPLHHVNLNLDAGWKILRAGFTATAESRRYTTSDNSEWLPATFLTDIFIGAGFTTGVTGVHADLKIDNLLNTPSESVRNYPLPLRTFDIRITLTWSEKQKK